MLSNYLTSCVSYHPVIQKLGRSFKLIGNNGSWSIFTHYDRPGNKGNNDFIITVIMGPLQVIKYDNETVIEQKYITRAMT